MRLPYPKLANIALFSAAAFHAAGIRGALAVSAQSSPVVPKLTDFGLLNGPTPAQCSTIKNRTDCGYMGIAADECVARGCCYQKQAGSPSCYFAGEGVEVDTVHVIFSNHLDVGYTALAPLVVDEYFDLYFPRAASVGEQMDKLDIPGKRLQWLSHSFLTSLLDSCPLGYETDGVMCPNDTQISAYKKALQNGHIQVHAFPHNGELEVLEPSLLQFGVNVTRDLTKRAGVPMPKVLSQRDVPGFPRAAIPLLQEAGVAALSEGSNSAMHPPNVPPAFVWKDEATGTEQFVMWHALGYGMLPAANSTTASLLRASGFGQHQHQHRGRGGQHQHAMHRRLHGGHVEQLGAGGDAPPAARDYLQIPGCPHVLVYAWRSDNHGPAESTKEVLDDFKEVQSWFPGAQVVASTLDNFTTHAFASGAKNAVPTVTAEIGDTWVMGVPSDPVKTMRMRSTQRLREQCVVAGEEECLFPEPVDGEAAASPASSPFYNFSRLLLKASEHTWGVSGSNLGDFRATNWSNADFHREVQGHAKELQTNPLSWTIQRKWAYDYPLSALPETSTLRRRIEEDVAQQKPVIPDTSGFREIKVPSANDSDQTIALGGVAGGIASLEIDASTGGLISLIDTESGRNWASSDEQLARVRYQTLNAANYTQFIDQYLYYMTSRSWANSTYGKYGIEEANPNYTLSSPAVLQAWERSDVGSGGVNTTTIVLRQAFGDSRLHDNYGAPEEVWVILSVGPGTESALGYLSRGAEEQAALGGPPNVVVNVTCQFWNKTSTRMLEGGYMSLFPKGAAKTPPQAALHGGARRLHAGHHVHAHPSQGSNPRGPEYLRHGAIRDLMQQAGAKAARSSNGGQQARQQARSQVAKLAKSVVAMDPRTPMERLWAAKALASMAQGEGEHRHKHSRGNSTRHNARRRFRSPYDANPYYEAFEDEDTLRLLGTCSEEHCRVGMRSPPIVEDLQFRSEALSAWSIRKLGRWQNAGDGVAWGGTAVQAVGDAIRYDGKAAQGGAGNLTVLVPDAGVVKFGPASPYPTPLSTGGQGTAEANVHLHNNAWSTNYLFWIPFQGAEEGTLHGSYQWRFSLELR